MPKKGKSRRAEEGTVSIHDTGSERAHRKKKQQLFRFGAAAIERLRRQDVGQYACPICSTLWFEGAIDAGMLTLEHVAPRAWVAKV